MARGKKQYRLLALALGLACGLSARAYAGELPPQIAGENIGIQIKTERLAPDDLARIAATGFRFVRLGMPWHRIEREKGRYRWDMVLDYEQSAAQPARATYSYDSLIADIRRQDLKAIVNLSGGNRFHTGPWQDVTTDSGRTIKTYHAPRGEKEINAFATYAAATAKHFSDLYGAENFIWAIWNEPNHKGGFAPDGNAAAYGRVLAAACKAIKQAVPNATVSGFSLGLRPRSANDFDMEFLRKALEAENALTCLDTIAIHPYRNIHPETASRDFKEIRATLKKFMPSGREVPLIVDEWGYNELRFPVAEQARRPRTYTQAEQANFLLRLYLRNMAEGMPLTIWYEWRDSGTDPLNPEHHYGLRDAFDTEKPAMLMAREILPRLHGYRFVRRLQNDGCGRDIHLLEFVHAMDKTRDPLVIAWREKGRGWLQTNLSESAMQSGRAVDALGREAKIKKSVTGKRYLLDPMPILLRPPIRNIRALTVSCHREP